jgi:hypothetical protein
MERIRNEGKYNRNERFAGWKSPWLKQIEIGARECAIAEQQRMS